MLLSIIIPVYNGEASIGKCLDHIWQLDIADYEVVCVNDCSTDGTRGVIEQMQRTHPNLRLVDNAKNVRAGGSRNHGVRVAKGEYIAFMDADDYYDKAFEQCVKIVANSDLDILCFDTARHLANEENMRPVYGFKCLETMSGRDFLVKNSLPYAPTRYIFRKSLMVDNDVWFAENCSSEDVDWTHKLALYAATMRFAPIVAYHYVLDENSTTGAEFRNKERVFDRIRCGYRVFTLSELCKIGGGKTQIHNVAAATLRYGIIFLNALFTSPLEKRRILRQYVPDEVNLGSLNLVKKVPLAYSVFSTLAAPVFRSLIILRRIIRRRR